MRNDQQVMRMLLRRCIIAVLLLSTTIILDEANAAAKESLRRSAIVVSVEKVSPAVVNISTMVTEKVNPFFPFGGDDFFKDFFPEMFSREYQRSSLGSGVIIDGEKGYIVTNHHVVARATEIKVITSNQKEYKGRSLGSDPRSDLAVIKIDANVKLPEAKLGNSEDLMIGETVIAIGNPFGLTHTVTTGVVSAIDRSVRAEDRIYRHFIQTDASINPGNSGGPLLNIDGDVIGINTAIYQKAQGIGFAIPVSKAKRIVKELLRAGEVRPPWLGLDLQDLTPELKRHFALPAGGGGVLVSDVYRGQPRRSSGREEGRCRSGSGGDSCHHTLRLPGCSRGIHHRGPHYPQALPKRKRNLTPVAACILSTRTRPGNRLSSSGHQGGGGAQRHRSAAIRCFHRRGETGFRSRSDRTETRRPDRTGQRSSGDKPGRLQESHQPVPPPDLTESGRKERALRIFHHPAVLKLLLLLWPSPR